MSRQSPSVHRLSAPNENSPGSRMPLQNRTSNMSIGQSSAVVVSQPASTKSSARPSVRRSQATGPPSSHVQSKDAGSKRKSNTPDSTASQPVSKKTKATTMPAHMANVLDPLLSNLEMALRIFGNHTTAEWYPGLQIIYESITKLTSREDILNSRYLNAPINAPSGSSILSLVETFQTLEDSRMQVLANAKALPSPSQFAISFPLYQRDSALALRTGRSSDPFPLVLLDSSFYNYTIMRSNIRPFQSGVPLDKDATTAWKCARNLLDTMPRFFTSHEHRLSKFSDAMSLLLPNDSAFEWVPNSPILPGAQERFDLVYMRVSDKYPLVALELKLELGTGGDPFFQNARAYDIITTKKPHYRKFGFPMFFIQIAGTSLTFGGAFCDSDDGSPIFGHLVGGVILESNAGISHFEATASLWALKHTFNMFIQNFPKLSNSGPRQPPSTCIPNAPRQGITSDRIRVTSVLKPGILYTVETNLNNSSPKQHSQPQTYCMKAIYPMKHAIAPSRQSYGLAVHKYLARDGRAPRFYFAESPAPNFPDALNQSLASITPIVQFYIMDYLPPPSGLESGWISLHEFGSSYVQAAKNAWEDVNTALHEMIRYLQKEGWVHGDLRANNVMIEIKFLKDEHDSDSESNQPPSCIIECRPGSKLVHLKLVDCDWSGKAGTVCYPLDRNPKLFWPGEAGGPISKMDDEEMVHHWMKNWPESGFATGLKHNFLY